MHRAEENIKSWVAKQLKSSKCDRLNESIAISASQDLILDTKDYAYSGLISIFEAISNFKKNGYSWGTIKAYYSCFYLLRALLAAKNIAIYNRENLNWYVECVDKGLLIKTVASSHVSVIQAFRNQAFSKNILQEEENGRSILDKLQELRVQANYKNSPFSDPEPFPSIQLFSENFDSRKVLDMYGSNPELYQYDDKHLLLAFPIYLWSLVKTETEKNGTIISFNEIQRKHLIKYLEQFNCKYDRVLSFYNISNA